MLQMAAGATFCPRGAPGLAYGLYTLLIFHGWPASARGECRAVRCRARQVRRHATPGVTSGLTENKAQAVLIRTATCYDELSGVLEPV